MVQKRMMSFMYSPLTLLPWAEGQKKNYSSIILEMSEKKSLKKDFLKFVMSSIHGNN